MFFVETYYICNAFFVVNYIVVVILSTDKPIFVLDLEESLSSINKKNLQIFYIVPTATVGSEPTDLSGHEKLDALPTTPWGGVGKLTFLEVFKIRFMHKTVEVEWFAFKYSDAKNKTSVL